MAFLGHSGPLRPVGRDSRSTARRPKGAEGGSHLAPKPKFITNPLDPKVPKDPLDTNLAINPVGPIFGHGPAWTIIPAMASGSHQRPKDQLSRLFSPA
ncbi:hypothetical protein O181_066451 [Austropuccinia psidii MF-1]|uniref:Uncharacterized protein n=1 Tax=Austropuccinia psidii MF-1 TaxID=1389203 RepID=A0A9Q3I277_9BASI|nr:hypothetical protein [Austropuccinia psidii MF-1]